LGTPTPSPSSTPPQRGPSSGRPTGVERANQSAARYLRTLGVGPEVKVGICIHRSLEAIVGLLGILKAGAAYVPLDPTIPRERMAFILGDVETPLLLTAERCVAGLPALSAQVVCLDADWRAVARECAENLGVAVAPRNLAQVILVRLHGDAEGSDDRAPVAGELSGDRDPRIRARAPGPRPAVRVHQL
jgi:acyl-coenzyme A synthetase/AMP-(fatty) acid ligase